MLNQIKVANLNLNPVTKQELLTEIEFRIKSNQKTFLTTLYSEFLYHSLRDHSVRDMLNKADLAIADGIGILWAEYFLSRNTTSANIYFKIIQSWWQVIYTGAVILLNPKKMLEVFPEKIVGADLFWDLASLARENQFTVYLVGWFDQQTEQVKAVLEQNYPGIKITGFSNSRPEDGLVVAEINQLKPDMTLVAYGRIKQERWIVKHLDSLNTKFIVGLGGSFDYAIGKQTPPPKFIRRVGLEWFYRLFTQPHRISRIYQAVWGLVKSLVQYKIYHSYQYRANVVSVVVNQDGKIWLGQRGNKHFGHGDEIETYKDYWQFSQGGIDQSEDLITAAKRELQEETGMTSLELLGVAKNINRYTWEQGKRSVRYALSKGYQYKGQEQQTVFFRFLGDDQEIKLDNQEVIDYLWLSPEEIIKKIADVRRPHAEVILKELAEIIEKSA